MGTQKDVLNESEAKTAARKRCCWLLKGSPWCHHTHMGALDGLAELSPFLSLLPYPISLKPLFSHTKYLQHILREVPRDQVNLAFSSINVTHATTIARDWGSGPAEV